MLIPCAHMYVEDAYALCLLQIIYDPDPNPKNEEQAIARSHRIGQTREVHRSCTSMECHADATHPAICTAWSNLCRNSCSL